MLSVIVYKQKLLTKSFTCLSVAVSSDVNDSCEMQWPRKLWKSGTVGDAEGE